MSEAEATLELAAALIERPSLTPEDAGCQELVAGRLEAAGFAVERLRFGQVANLLAWHGEGSPCTLLVGHTDVVPPGPEAAWRTPPFRPALREGRLYGRGAADMKGAVAAFTVALEAFVAAHPRHAGRVGLLLTSDEEGPAVDGTARVVARLRERGERVDFALVGEASGRERLGDRIRVGRRGSLSAELRVRGRQGHVAYPERVDNPIHRLGRILARLAAERWDEGDADFPPTTLQVTAVAAGVGAANVVPGEARAAFNLRFGPACGGAEALRARVAGIVAAEAPDHALAWTLGAEPFRSAPGPLRRAVLAAVAEILGLVPEADTGGGTSDGRFLAAAGAEVVELGPAAASIHQVDEHVPLSELAALPRLYRRILELLHPG
ncbi:MAG: succinyl-diaminopimelate desuccinylase [Xanthomonadales bacterium]|nr:succinyl-diaminopimelate desuccinylase [Xanthomonadales bacterium]